jgi:hypothetical protein
MTLDRPVSVFIVRSLEDRRKLSREESGYTGPERRSGTDRRQQPDPLRRKGKRRPASAETPAGLD